MAFKLVFKSFKSIDCSEIFFATVNCQWWHLSSRPRLTLTWLMHLMVILAAICDMRIRNNLSLHQNDVKTFHVSAGWTAAVTLKVNFFEGPVHIKRHNLEPRQPTNYWYYLSDYTVEKVVTQAGFSSKVYITLKVSESEFFKKLHGCHVTKHYLDAFNDCLNYAFGS